MVQWRGRRQSGNVDDRRDRRYRRAAGRPLMLRVLGLPGLLALIVVAAAAWLLGDDRGPTMGELVGGETVVTEGEIPPGQEADAEFASVILADTEDVWQTIFAAEGLTYPEPTMVLYAEQIPSACGFARSAVGPFYCPEDETIYLDLTFFDELETRLGAEGDFAPAYVIAHEVGHHVQFFIGALEEGERRMQGLTQSGQNAVQVRIELMADCMAGVWANHAEEMLGILDPGDIREGMEAAAAVGDDTLQRRAQGRTAPDSFTHGTSEQRSDWFMRGFEAGQVRDCDTFEAEL